jgi:hypothetical protein
MDQPAAPERARFRDVLGVAEFRVLLIAQAQSRVGDQLARVALALLVYDRYSSAALTTLVYALTYLPPLLSAPFLSGLADRYPRRTVMVVTDVVRACLVALMVIPGLPLPVIAALVVLLTCPQPLFSAARNATIPSILTGDRFTVGMSIVNVTDFVSQLVHVGRRARCVPRRPARGAGRRRRHVRHLRGAGAPGHQAAPAGRRRPPRRRPAAHRRDPGAVR